ncbi:MAG: YnbE family lipoprotein [Alphaproteobacteria bacterium]|nr:YnbE family lipoprotein [Alphaproteobacteria bacterium]MCB1551650.1 YnbE family lipoprotein [Alphaproteobacteria bacterium]MCB9984133.1 YnbE family lipoprotein [Micavibrio sp.]
MMTCRTLLSTVLCTAFCGVFLAGCTPTVKIEAPDKPIEINMNIKIEQEVRVRVEKDLDAGILENPELFGVTP